MNWQELEVAVRQIAESHFSCAARAETIAGVKCDCVLRVSDDEMIFIEITKEKSLSKLRTDLAKFATIKSALVPEGIVARCFFVSSYEVNSLRASGQAQKVQVLDLSEFREKFVGKSSYENARKKSEFGSAVDPETGEADKTKYIPIRYFKRDQSQGYGIDDIEALISSGKKVILLGEFGTGKSRCAEQVFQSISKKNILFPTIAINLRRHWGHQSCDLIVRSHFSELGLSNLADQVVRLVNSGQMSFILDGFDEIGSQSWSGEPDRLREIRRRSLVGVRDLVSKVRDRGVLLCGREHYFSNDDEMLSCLGLTDDAVIITCPNEFSDEQAQAYVNAVAGLSEFPEWGPRKPLICQLFAKIPSDELKAIMSGSTGEVDFFHRSLDAICKRETRIHATIDETTLRSVLLEISRSTRKKSDVNEEISPIEINEIFHTASGLAPLDEAASILQRLPYLGRVEAGSGNRRFIDSYAKSGLRGLDFCDAVRTQEDSFAAVKFIKPVGEFGNNFLCHYGLIGQASENFVRLCTARGNTQVAADYISACIVCATEKVNLSRTPVFDASFESLNIAGLTVTGLQLERCYIDKLSVESSDFIDSQIVNSIIPNIEGFSNKGQLPSIFDQNCEFESFTSVDNVARISELPLTNSQKTLIAIIRKLFFQPGRGRMEEGLLRGASKYWNKDAAEIVIKYMIANSIVSVVQGDSGKLFIPDRTKTRRMGEIRSNLSNSTDDLWALVS